MRSFTIFFSHMDGVRKKNLHAQLNVGRWPFMNTSYELHDKADILSNRGEP